MNPSPVAAPTACSWTAGRGGRTPQRTSNPLAKPKIHNPHCFAARDRTHDVNSRNTATPQRGTKGVATNMAQADDPMSLWASSAVTQLLDGQDDPPRYGSAAWRRLPNDDPRRAAAIIGAAELWRRFGDEQELMTWFRDASRHREPLASRRTLAELDALARRPATPVRATDGWPPVAIPGRPGWRRHLVDGQQIDLRDNAQESAA